MKFVRVLIVCLVLDNVASSAFSQTFNGEPKLGPIVPLSSLPFDAEAPATLPKEPELGPIILIAALDEFEFATGQEISLENTQDSPASDGCAIPNPGYGPIRVICQPAVAPMVEAPPFAYPGPIADLPHPDEIQFQLSCIANQLIAARLPVEAAKIQEFQRTFQRDHYQRLLISFKESQLHALQAEIASLKQNQQSFVTESQICMHFCVVELNEADADQQFSKSFCKDFDDGQIREFVAELCARGDAKIVAEPNSTVLNGRNALVQFNDKFDLVAAIEGVVPVGIPAVFQNPGLTLRATPRCLESSNTQLELTIESSDAAVNSIPSSATRRLSTVQEIPQGRTLGVVFRPASGHSEQIEPDAVKSLLILVTPEVVRSYDLPDFSNSQPRIASEPTPLRQLPRPAIVGADGPLLR